MAIDFTFKPTDLLLLVGFIAQFAVIRADVKKMTKLLFDDDGQVKVVTFTALDRRRKECQKARTKAEDKLQKDIDKLDDKVDKSRETNTTRVAELSECVGILQHGTEVSCH